MVFPPFLLLLLLAVSHSPIVQSPNNGEAAHGDDDATLVSARVNDDANGFDDNRVKEGDNSMSYDNTWLLFAPLPQHNQLFNTSFTILAPNN